MNDADPDDPDEDGDAESPSGTELLGVEGRLAPSGPLSRLFRAPARRGSVLRTLRLRPRRCRAPLAEHWVAEVLADRQVYDRVVPSGLVFPEGREAVVVDLDGPELLIGRRHEGRGIEPAIDLSGPLADPAASHRHARLARLDDGGYSVTDLGSTNGTQLNDGRITLEPGRTQRLVDGDRIHVGAWTTITVRRLQ